jgi:RHS repeat-associated protein
VPTGLVGRGGSSCIDSVILRDKDANTGWTSAADGTLEDRVFYAQNWRADVVAITKSDGQPTEFIRYASYGVAQAFAAADVNRDGTVNSADSSDWNELYTDSGLGNAAIPVDFDFDGSSFNPDDNDAFTAAYNEASGWNNGGLGAGGGKLSRIGNRKGYAGYEYDPAIVSYHVRHRVYVPEIGRWTKRDPLGYVDGMSAYEYARSRTVAAIDPFGLRMVICNLLNVPAGTPEFAPGLRTPGGPGQGPTYKGRVCQDYIEVLSCTDVNGNETWSPTGVSGHDCNPATCTELDNGGYNCVWTSPVFRCNPCIGDCIEYRRWINDVMDVCDLIDSLEGLCP